MDPYVMRFLRSALVWLLLGVTLGAAMALRPAWQVYRPVHLHMLLLGFVFMMIAGVAYHVLPRFAATPLHAPRLAMAHVYLANVGLALLVTGFALRARAAPMATWFLALGGIGSAVGAYAFVWNLWRTLDRAALPFSQLARAPTRAAG
ncbi:MAG: cbb3-type cytochrome c oxidase subunit I [Gemmatimonadales bacterium]|nr:cbb3-type cytochrome c oxidase subunit I [Gemmatimonadales bacterium]